ncbi:TIGR01777 family oxidoreductase [Tunicatimonas pelagia]|uniref:TIGR01777 family oxidoreductase n=1 Tax=Tunicatimonas pelagia TaxID=931531 RepID=UPI002666F203|nr:TIGR01777 family oxidoreductase [Tunicatimonas pelagia]WKN46171.1 TIGR01777 family oxidoreductase [Tunicatimonas pelagia]
MNATVLISGGTGLVGTRLTQLLQEKGYTVTHLSRSVSGDEKVKTYQWNIKKKEIDPEALIGVDYIIHLAGAGIADKRWTDKRKELILKSRTESTELLRDSIAKLNNHAIKAFVSASAVGYYGIDTGKTWVDEESPSGDGFAAEVTHQWEAAVDKINPLNLRVVKIRIGIVLSEKGGALVKIMQPIKFGVGAPLGRGNQYMSWVHLDDLCRLFIFALEQREIQGVYNGVAPNPATNHELTKKTADVLNKPLFLPNIPAFALKLLLGEMAQVVTGGNRVKSDKIEKAGFEFKYTDLRPALVDLLK